MYVDAWVPEQQVPPIVDNFAKDKNARTYFLIGSDYAFGRGMLGFTRKYIEKTGGKVVGEEYLPWTAPTGRLSYLNSKTPSLTRSSPQPQAARQMSR
jgi:urea transport system substrate-binding protein